MKMGFESSFDSVLGLPLKHLCPGLEFAVFHFSLLALGLNFVVWLKLVSDEYNRRTWFLFPSVNTFCWHVCLRYILVLFCYFSDECMYIWFLTLRMCNNENNDTGTIQGTLNLSHTSTIGKKVKYLQHNQLLCLWSETCHSCKHLCVCVCV